MTASEFYSMTKDTLQKLADIKGISDLSAYYELTDYDDNGVLNEHFRKKDLTQVFAQIAGHAQNATMISSIVKFEKNIGFLKEKLCGFDVEKFLETYPAFDDKQKRESTINEIVEALRYNEQTNKGLKWDSSKSEKKDSLMKRYANTLLDAAVYLSKFDDREQFRTTLINNYKEKGYIEAISDFRKNINHGFSIALTCDFLKEFDEAFCDLPKPDVHIQDTLCVLKNFKKGSSDKKQFECIKLMQELTEEINKGLEEKKKDKITVYKLDKMIWLICSQKFYLDEDRSIKASYLNKISNKT